MRTTGRLMILLVIAVAVILLSSPAARADIEDTVEKNFTVHAGGTLVISSDLGSIEVRSGVSDKVMVKIFRKFDASTSKGVDEILGDVRLDATQTGDRVEVVLKYRRENHFWGHNRLQIRFEVQVPKKFNVDLTTSGGSVSVDDLEGTVLSKTSGGSLSFGNIVGPVTGRTSGGSIRLAGCKGDADVRTSGGSITLGHVEGNVSAATSGGSISIDHAAGRVAAHTSGGSIHAQSVMGAIEASTSGGTVSAEIGRQPDGPCRLTTSGGSVQVRLAETIKMDLDAHTSGGRVHSDFPITVQGDLGKSAIEGPINGGGPLLYLRTSGGNINIEKLLSN